MIVATVASAIDGPQALPLSPLVNCCNARVMVLILLLFRMSSGQKYSFHELIKNKILIALIDGLTSGITMRVIVVKWETLSNLAASTRDLGICLIACLILIIPIASAIWGSATPTRVESKCILFIVR